MTIFMTLLMTARRVFIVVVAALLLLSCSSNDKPTEAKQGKDSRGRDTLFSAIVSGGDSRAALEIPPDLLASSNRQVQTNNQTGVSAGGLRVLPVVIGAAIKTDQYGGRWIEIDADAELVWRKLTEFWAFEGIELTQHQPEAGLMETDWFARTAKKTATQGIGSVTKDLFAAFVARRTALDKFSVRLERNLRGGTNLFVTHRGREKIAKEFSNKQKATEFHWVEREQNAEKVSQLLQAIVLLFDSGGSDSGGDGSS